MTKIHTLTLKKLGLDLEKSLKKSTPRPCKNSRLGLDKNIRLDLKKTVKKS